VFGAEQNERMEPQKSYLQELFGNPLLWICLIVITGALLIAGCAHQVNAPLPPGALNAFDADSYRTLSDGHAAIQSIQQDAAAGKLTLDANQKTVLNKAIADVNTADHLYQAYHASGAGDTTALSTAIQQIVADLALLSTVPTAATTPAK
jgi:hypothetical protein